MEVSLLPEGLSQMESTLKSAVSAYFATGRCLSENIPADSEAALTNLLFFSRWPLEEPEETMKKLLNKGPRQVCQYQFKKNDIVWICKSCQKDETCVLCNECFQDSEGKHEGHEVYFYHSQAGGCCDCGDEGAWDAKGFCNKHGKNFCNPLDSIPVDVQEAGHCVMNQIVEELVQYCVNVANSYDTEELKTLCVDDGKVYDLLLQNDDIHTVEEVISALSTLDMSSQDAASIASIVHTQGSAVIGSSGKFSAVLSRADRVLDVCDLHVNILEKNHAQREKTVLTVIHWLHRIAEVNDGMSRMICSALTSSRIQDIYVTDPHLPKNVASNLHHLFLTLMADQEFKIASSKAYAMAFSKVADLYVNGIGTQEKCLFGLSVQFLNRSIYVDGMVYNYGFLTSVANSLLSTLEQTEGDFSSIHPILRHRKYNPILGDMKVVFTLPDTSRYFCATCINQMLKVFELFQFIHPQTRQLLHHVEYEGRDWMHAFNLYLGFSSLFDYLVNWFVDKKSIENIEGPVILPNAEDVDPTRVFDPMSVEVLPTAMDLMMTIVSAIMAWQEVHAQARQLNSADEDQSVLWELVPYFPITLDSSPVENVAHEDDVEIDCATMTVEEIDNIYTGDVRGGNGAEFEKCDSAVTPPQQQHLLAIPIDMKEKSFHLFLHRFLATATREACRHPHISDSLLELQQYLHVTYGGDERGSEYGNQLIQLIDYPLQTIVWECQIRADMWKRNGNSMLDQIMNYSEPPFCRIFKDLDILLIQLCASANGIDRLLNHMIHRFGVFEYLTTKTIRSKSKSVTCSKLTESMLLLIITMVTELPLPAHADQTKRVEIMLRREVVHKLVGGVAAYSELQECMALVPECEKVKSSVLDDIISHVAEWQEHSSALEPSKLKIKESAWSEYDPCFTHVGERTHQHALEMRPKTSNISRPMCPDFNNLPAHPAFLSVRICVLSDPIMLTIVRDLLYANMIERISPLDPEAVSSLISEFPPSSHPQYAYYLLQRKWTLRCSGAVFSRTLQLLTLMVHNLSLHKSEQNGETSSCFVSGPSLQDRQESFERFLLTPGSLIVMSAEDKIFARKRADSRRFFEELSMSLPTSDSISPLTEGRSTTQSSQGSTDRVTDPGELVEELLTSLDCTYEAVTRDRKKQNGEGTSSNSIDEKARDDIVPLPPLLNTIMDIYDSLSSTGTDEDIFNKQSLLWIIGKLESTLSSKCGEVIENRMKQELHEKRRLEMKEKRDKARERAMSAMKKNAAAFAEHMEKEGITASSDDEAEEDLIDSTNEDDSFLPKCIICRGQHRSDPIGYLGLSQVSKYLSPQQREPKTIHLNATTNHISNLSEKDRVKRNMDDPNSHLHVQFCGHAMHSGCFDLFFATVIDRAETQNNLILDPSLGFFQCPFCKKLGNVLLPRSMRECDNTNNFGDKEEVQVQRVLRDSESNAWIEWMSWQSINGKQHSDDVKEDGSDERLWTSVSATRPAVSLKRVHESFATSSSFPPRRSFPASSLVQEQNQRQRQENSVQHLINGHEDAFQMSIGVVEDTVEDNVEDTEEEVLPPESAAAPPAARTSAMSTLVGLFRDITRYSQNRFSTAASPRDAGASTSSSSGSSSSSSTTTSVKSSTATTTKITNSVIAGGPQQSNIALILTAAEEEKKFKSQSLWFRCIGDLCQPLVPTPKLSSDMQHYELVPSRITSAVSSVAFSATIDFLENGSFFEQVVEEELLREKTPEDLASLHERLFDAFSGMKKGTEVSSRSKNIRLLSVLLSGVGEYVHSLGVDEVLCGLIVDAIVGQRVEASLLTERKEKVHWMTRVSFSKKMLNSGANDKQCFTSDDVATLLWKNDAGVNDEGTTKALDSGNEKYDNGCRVKSDWFSLPLLAMPLTDVLVFILAATPSIRPVKTHPNPYQQHSSDAMDVDQSGDGEGDNKELMMSCFKWICVASLVQISIAVSATIGDADFNHIDGASSAKPDADELSSTPPLPSMTSAALDEVMTSFPFVTTVISNTVNEFRGNSQFSDTRDELYYVAVESILAKWLLFMQSSLHLVGRYCPWLATQCARSSLAHQQKQRAPFASKKEASKLNGGDSRNVKLSIPELSLNLATIGLDIFVGEPNKPSGIEYSPPIVAPVISVTISRWIRELMSIPLNFSRSLISSCDEQKLGVSSVLSVSEVTKLVASRTLKASYPCSPYDQPRFVTLPNSYTKLHGMLTAVCDYDYPALCMTCGSIIDASGKGLCTTHNLDCSSGVGIYFLLQDCTILLLDGMRGTYYPAPYVDAHGEKHRSFRGKPLFIDAKRLKMLNKLWLSHGIANEVAAKRSNSARVIINGHY